MPVGGFETSTLRFSVQEEQSDKDSRLERILRAERRMIRWFPRPAFLDATDLQNTLLTEPSYFYLNKIRRHFGNFT